LRLAFLASWRDWSPRRTFGVCRAHARLMIRSSS
jgi:hypothetical protein